MLPIINLTNPINFINVSVNIPIVIEISEISELTSLQIYLNGETIIDGNFHNSEYQITIETIDFQKVRITLQKLIPFNPLTEIVISINIRDVLTQTHTFVTEDNRAPIFFDLNINPNDKNIEPNQVFKFKIKEEIIESKVNINSLEAYLISSSNVYFYVSQNLIYDQREVLIKSFYDGLEYHVEIIPIEYLSFSENFKLVLKVKDNADNERILEIPFQTIDKEAPQISLDTPLDNSIQNSINTPIIFYVYDKNSFYPGTGINIDSLNLLVNNISFISNGVFNPDFIENCDYLEQLDINGYKVTVIPKNYFTQNESILLDIYIEDNQENKQRTTFYFKTEDIDPPILNIRYPINNSININQKTRFLIDIISLVDIEDIDLESLQISLNSDLIIENGVCLQDYNFFVNKINKNKLSITLENNIDFILGSLFNLSVTISDIFGNINSTSSTFTVTSNLNLVTEIFPKGGIYENQFLVLHLYPNKIGAQTFYSIDDNPFSLYSSEIVLKNVFSSVNFYSILGNEIEEIKSSTYYFSDIETEVVWDKQGLDQGIDYNWNNKKINLKYANEQLIPIDYSKENKFDYYYDFGKLSYLDKLEFKGNGEQKFRLKIADTREELNDLNLWLNQKRDSLIQSSLTDITPSNNMTFTNLEKEFYLEGESRSVILFNDKKEVELKKEFQNFSIITDMKLETDPLQTMGGRGYIEVRDGENSLLIEKIISKGILDVDKFVNLNALYNQECTILRNSELLSDGYILVDGYQADVLESDFINQTTENLDFRNSIILEETPNFEISDDTTIIDLISKNKYLYSSDMDEFSFNYNDGYYSSAKVNIVNYINEDNRFVCPIKTSRIELYSLDYRSENFDVEANKFIEEEDVENIRKLFNFNDQDFFINDCRDFNRIIIQSKDTIKNCKKLELRTLNVSNSKLRCRIIINGKMINKFVCKSNRSFISNSDIYIDKNNVWEFNSSIDINKIEIYTRFDTFAQNAREFENISLFTEKESINNFTDYIRESNHLVKINNSFLTSSVNKTRLNYSIPLFLESNVVEIEEFIDTGVDFPYNFKDMGDIIEVQAKVLVGNTEIKKTIKSGSMVEGKFVVEIDNQERLNPSLFLNSHFYYPTLEKIYNIINCIEKVIIENDMERRFLLLTLDSPYFCIYDILGAIITPKLEEVVITDYIVEKASKKITRINQSKKTSGIVTISYKHSPIVLQEPEHGMSMSVDSSDVIRIESNSISNISLNQLERFSISFYNGNLGGVDFYKPPQNLSIEIITTNQENLDESYIASLINFTIIDGYQESLDFSPIYRGQLVRFDISIEKLIGLNGLENRVLKKVIFTFSGRSNYYLGEVEAILKSTIFESKMRVILNGEIYYTSDKKVDSKFDKYKIEVNKGFSIVSLNYDSKIKVPVYFDSPKIIFGASGKAFDDFIKVTFKNNILDQYFDEQISDLNLFCRYCIVEGVIL